MKTETKKIIAYLIFLSLLSVIAYAVVINYKKISISPVLGIFILMWCPALSAFITQLIFTRSLRGFGWGIDKPRWLILSYLLPAVCGTLAYGFLWLTGLAGIDNNFKFNFFNFAIFGLIFNFIFAAGEEIGWRGFLVPNLFRVTGFTKTCLLSGIIWTVWHFPLIIAGMYLSTVPTAISLMQLLVVIMAISFTINWLRLKSQSVWPAVLLHASHNLYMQWLFDPLTTFNNPLSKYLSGESGFALIAVYGIVGFIFWRKRSQLFKGN